MGWELSQVLKAPWAGQVLNRIPDRAHGAENTLVCPLGNLSWISAPLFTICPSLSFQTPLAQTPGPPILPGLAVTSPPQLPGQPTTRHHQQCPPLCPSLSFSIDKALALAPGIWVPIWGPPRPAVNPVAVTWCSVIHSNEVWLHKMLMKTSKLMVTVDWKTALATC